MVKAKEFSQKIDLRGESNGVHEERFTTTQGDKEFSGHSQEEEIEKGILNESNVTTTHEEEEKLVGCDPKSEESEGEINGNLGVDLNRQ